MSPPLPLALWTSGEGPVNEMAPPPSGRLVP